MKREEERLYIAYGSNLNLSQMEKRCPGATVVGTGEVKGYELLFRGVATIEPRENASVCFYGRSLPGMKRHWTAMKGGRTSTGRRTWRWRLKGKTCLPWSM